MISQQVHGKVITVNSNGTSSLLCCKHGVCLCSSLYKALIFTDNNTVINITSPAVSLNTVAAIGGIGSLKVNDGMYNITVTSNGNVTVMCNNTGNIVCYMCSNVTIQAIIWDQCGSIDYPDFGGIAFLKASDISIISCIFQNSMYCVTVKIFWSKGSIRLINSQFIFNTVSNISLCEGRFYSSLLIYQAEPNAHIHIHINNSLFYSNENANQQSDISNGSLVYFNTNMNVPYVSILVENTNFISNGMKGMNIYDAAVFTNITLVAINVSNNKQGVYIFRTSGGDCFLMNIFLSIFTFNNNGALYIHSSYCGSIGIYNTTYIGNEGNDYTTGTAMSILLASNETAVNIMFCNFLSNNGGESVAEFSSEDVWLLILQCTASP